MQLHSMVPNIITCTALISGPDEGKRCKWSLEVFKIMRQQQGIMPNAISIALVIMACAVWSEWVSALDLFVESMARGLDLIMSSDSILLWNASNTA